MATTYTINTTQMGQAQKGLEADYYQMEAWETSTDDVSGSGNLNYQEVELKLDKNMLSFGTGLENTDDSEPALMRSKAVEEASFFTQGDSAPVKEMTASGPAMMPMSDGFSSQLANVQNYTPPVANLDSDGPMTFATSNFNPPDTSTANGPMTTISSEDGSVTNIFNGGCCHGGGITINVDAPVTNIINVIVDVINIGGDIINIDLGVGGDGGITINPDIDINLGDIINGGINVIVDLGDTINIGGDINLEVIGVDVDADINLGIGDGGLDLGVDFGLGDLPLLGDALEELISIDLGLGDGSLDLDASIIGGDLLDLGLELGEDGLGIGAGIGLPPLFGGDPLSLLDVDIDLGDGLGLGIDLLGEDLLDLGLLGEDGLNVGLLGEDLLGGDNPIGGLLDGATDTVDELLGGIGSEDPVGGILEGASDVVDELLGGGGDGDPVGGALNGVTDVVGDLLGGGDDGSGPIGGILEGISDTADGLLGGIGDGDNPIVGALDGASDVADDLLGGGDNPVSGVLDGLGDVLEGGELLDVELLNDDGALLDVDLFGDGLVGGDDGLLCDVVGTDGVLDGLTDDLGASLDLVDLELGGSDDGGLLASLDLGGEEGLDITLLGDDLLDVDLAGNDLLGGDGDIVSGVVDSIDGLLGGGDCGCGDGLLGGVTIPDILPDSPSLPNLGGLFG